MTKANTSQAVRSQSGRSKTAAALASAPAGARFVSGALAGLVPDVEPGGPRALPDRTTLEALALERSPTLQAHLRRVAAQERRVALAGKATRPDFNVTAGYSYRDGFGDFFNVMVAVPLPIFAGRKQSQSVLEADAVLAEQEARHRTMVLELNAEIAALDAELARTRDQLLLLAEGILPQARTALSAATASYRVGRVDFHTLLDAQVTLYQHELGFHRLLADFATGLADLERVVGTEVLR
ncbi:MAG: TolC family protein [Longimicrobiales bacterium]|nr:TolC family protein [Longimicrobiales bacterium]